MHIAGRPHFPCADAFKAPPNPQAGPFVSHESYGASCVAIGDFMSRPAAIDAVVAPQTILERWPAYAGCLPSKLAKDEGD
jgi:hypothetical protein